MNPLYNAPYNPEDVTMTFHKCSTEETEYRRKLQELVAKHNLEFDLNPGGGVFYNDDCKLQVSAMTFKDDYNDLVAFYGVD